MIISYGAGWAAQQLSRNSSLMFFLLRRSLSTHHPPPYRTSCASNAKTPSLDGPAIASTYWNKMLPSSHKSRNRELSKLRIRGCFTSQSRAASLTDLAQQGRIQPLAQLCRVTLLNSPCEQELLALVVSANAITATTCLIKPPSEL
jgi:hypothetical protein